MKKLFTLLALCALMTALLVGCSSKTVSDIGEGSFEPDTENNVVTVQNVETEEVYTLPTPEADAPQDVPLDVTAEPVQDEPAEVSTQAPTEIPTEAPTATPEPYTYSLVPLSDRSFGFLFAYPSGWTNLPGKHTVCYRESGTGDDLPARVAVTVKTLAHTPKDETVLNQFRDYAELIHAQYDAATFEYGTLNTNIKFMGNRAYEITYLAYVGDTEVKGYMICTSIEKKLFAFHFVASYEDYTQMETMMKQMRDTVTLVENK